MSETYDVIESILQAMDIVSNKNLNGVAFDETIECEIVDNSDAKNGHYWVSDGSTRFEAYSEKNSYAKGAKVLVKIPCGDYSATKYIEGLAETEDGQPITYLSAINTIMDIVELTEKKPIEYTDPAKGIGLIANGTEKTKLIWSFDFTNAENANIWLEDIYTSFYIEADFKTNLNNVKNGTYGLYFEIGIRLANGNILTQYYNLNSTEFFGNPYRFAFFTNQSKKFNIKNFKKFETIRLFFSQGGDFKDKTNNDYPIDVTENLFVNNIRVGLGTDLTEIPDNTVKLITLNSSGYGKENMADGDIYSDQVQLDFLWYNKTEENKYLGFSDGIARIKMNDDEELYSEYEKNNKTCGLSRVKDHPKRLNTKNYDEELYLDLIQEDERLQQQKNENMPTDKKSLEIMANVKDAHNALIKINNLITKDFKNVYNTFKSNMHETDLNLDQYFQYNKEKDIDTNPILKELFSSFKIEEFTLFDLDLNDYINGELLGEDESKKDKISFLKYFENIFKYIAAVQKSLLNDPVDPLKEISRDIPSDFINIENITELVEESGWYRVRFINTKNVTALYEYLILYETILLYKIGGLEDNIKNNYSNYIKYYNNFVEKITKLFDKYDDYSDLIANFINIVISFKRVNNELDNELQQEMQPIPFWEISIDKEQTDGTFKNIITYNYNTSTDNLGYYNKIDVWEKPTHSLFDNLYSIYWYRYEKDYEDSNDPFGEKDWKRIKGDTDGNLFKEYRKKSSETGEYLFEPLEKDVSKIINLGLPKVNDEWIDNKKYWNAKAAGNETVSLLVTLNPQKMEERFKVVLVYNHERYDSNELIFTNIHHPNNQEVITDGVLEIKHSSNSQDHYAIYSAASMQLLNSNDSYVKRKIEASYKEDISSGHIYWYFPVASTQLELPDESELSSFTAKEKIQITNKVLLYIKDDGGNFIEKTELDGEIEKKCYGEPDKEVDYEILERETNDSIEYYKIEINEEQVWVKSTHGIRKTYDSLDGYVCFSKELKGDDDELKLSYRIKNNYNPNYTTNIIKCEIITSDGVRLSGNKGFTFSTFGSNGTDYTLIVRPADPLIPAFQGNDSENIFSLNVEVYNKNGEKENVNTIEAEWINNITKYSFNIIGNNRIDISLDKDKLDKDKFIGLLKVSATIDSLPINLDTTYPIAWSSDRYRLSGPTIIPYNSQGVLMNYDKTPYEIYSISNNELVDDQTVEMIYVDNNLGTLAEVKYMPRLKDNILIPSPLYVENVDIYPIVEIKNTDGKLLFSQPILIQQNRFESSFLNGWDGTLQIDEEGNTIMSAMVGAGIKNSDNSFSGVLMGNVEGKAGFAESGIGLYGFHHGGQSFGFNVDGTAFLGKSGAGRIEFDGNRSVIYSSNWYQSFYETDEEGNIVLKDLSTPPFNNDGTINKGTDGLCIDLDDGRIDAYNFKLTSNYVNFDSSESAQDWMFIGDENTTYLQFTAQGGLNIKVTNFELTYHQGENLLINTCPLEDSGKVLSYEESWYEEESEKNIYQKRHIFEIDGEKVYIEYKKGSIATDEILNSIKQIKKANDIATYDTFYTTYDGNDDNDICKYKTDIGDNFINYDTMHLAYFPVGDILKDEVKVKPVNVLKEEEETDLAKYITKYKKDKEDVYRIDDFIKNGIGGIDYVKRLFYSIPILKANDYIILKNIFNKYFEINNDGDLIFKQDTWIRTEENYEKLQDLKDDNKAKSFLAFSFEDEDTKRKCIELKKKNYTLIQNLSKSLKTNTNYVLSGKVWINDSMEREEETIILEITVGNVPKSITIKDLKKSEEDNNWYNIKLHFKNVADDLDIIQIKDFSDRNISGEKNHTLFYHLKLEEGLTATAWNQSTQEQDYVEKTKTILSNKTDSDINNLNAILDTSEIFNRLTDKGQKQGLFTDPNTNSLFINASCIGVGLLRSNDVQGTFSYSINDEEKATSPSLDDYDYYTKRYKDEKFVITDINLDTGTLFDLRSGIIAAHKFELDAWDNSTGGIYLNSQPKDVETRKHYLKIGNPSTYIQFDKDGNLDIRATNFELTYALGQENLLRDTGPSSEDDYKTETIQPFTNVNLDEQLDVEVKELEDTDFKTFNENILFEKGTYNWTKGWPQFKEQRYEQIKYVYDPEIQKYIKYTVDTDKVKEGKDKYFSLNVNSTGTYYEFLRSKYNKVDKDLYIIFKSDTYNCTGENSLTIRYSPKINSNYWYNLKQDIYLRFKDEKKCIYINSLNQTSDPDTNFILQQQIPTEKLEKETDYILSGLYFIDGTTLKDKIQFSFTLGDAKPKIEDFQIGKWAKFKILVSTTNNINDGINFAIKTTENDENLKIYFHHLKLEKGRTATSWIASPDDKSEIKTAISNYNNTLDQNAIFNKLTNNGSNKGIYMNGNELYINATAIGTGLLRSNSVKGTFDYTYNDNGEIKEIKNKDLLNYSAHQDREKFTVTNINLTEGTLFDLNSGLFLASDCTLKFSSKHFYFYKDYPYQASDARSCLRYSARLKFDYENKEQSFDPKDYKEGILNYLIDKGKDNLYNELKDLDPEQVVLKCYDVNGDGKITAADARLIMRKTVSLINGNENSELIFNKSGLIVTSNGGVGPIKNNEEVFSVENGIVYAKILQIFNPKYQNEKEVSNDMFYDVGEKIQELLNGQSKLTWGQMYPQRKLDEVIIDILKKLKMISTDTEKNEAGDAYYLASSTTSD